MTYQQATYEFSEALVNLYHQAYAANERLGIHFKAGIMTQSELEKALQTTPTFVKVLDKQLVSSVSVRLLWSDNPSPDLPWQLPSCALPGLFSGHQQYLP